MAVEVEHCGLQGLDGLGVDAVELVGQFRVGDDLGRVGGQVAVEGLVGDSAVKLSFSFGFPAGDGRGGSVGLVELSFALPASFVEWRCICACLESYLPIDLRWCRDPRRCRCVEPGGSLGGPGAQRAYR